MSSGGMTHLKKRKSTVAKKCCRGLFVLKQSLFFLDFMIIFCHQLRGIKRLET